MSCDVIRHHGDARRWCRSLSMAGAPIKTRIVVDDVLKVIIYVPERDTLAASEVSFSHFVAFPMDGDVFASIVAKAVADAWAHEALEWLRSDGKRLADPHHGRSW